MQAMGSHGRADFLDVTFVQPLARSFPKPETSTLTLNAARFAKRARYEGPIAADRRERLASVPLSVLGAWHSDAYAFVSELATNVGTRAMDSFSWATMVLMHTVDMRHRQYCLMPHAPLLALTRSCRLKLAGGATQFQFFRCPLSAPRLDCHPRSA
eukprot:GFKZ01004225.1.p2 GENE.GFKZ01004225.1~~GFKZ01004225.1.p2  ORF type:complete len:156 (+),score=0.70 GFKZ01004225.1:801-1268(+)